MTSETAACVLVVDDDVAVGTVLVALLQQAGMTASHVPSGDAALRTLDHAYEPVSYTHLAIEVGDIPAAITPICVNDPVVASMVYIETSFEEKFVT